MRIKFNQTAKGKCYYVIRSVYKNGRNTSETIEKLGYPEDIRKEHGCDDPFDWMQKHLVELNEQEAQEKQAKVLIPFDPYTVIATNQIQCFNTGYLFLQQIYYQLKLDLICKRISKQYAFSYDLNAVLSSLIYGRILYPGSKLSTWKQSRELLNAPEFEYQHVVRSLSVLAKEFNMIQAELYKNSCQVIPRKTGVLYYDCTNFYFETEEEDDISNEEADKKGIAARKYGYSKQHQPSPLVQMGLFMDYSGIPLAMCINRGNKNEQQTLIPLEDQIMQDFELSRFVVCTDAGLSSEPNRMFNNFGERSYVTTVSIKKMEKALKTWCLEPTGWHAEGEKETIDIRHLEDTEEDRARNYKRIFYKEKYIEGYDEERDISFGRTLMVTYSLKYRDYLRYKREGQIQRAKEAIENDHTSLEKKNAHDYRRFVDRKAKDKDGKNVRITYGLNEKTISEEAQYDGFYALETNLEDDIMTILSVVRGRWEIEESFRIMKDDFRSRPVYLGRNDRIKAHFLTCFISLMIYRILEKKLDGAFTCDELLHTLRDMKMTRVKDQGYIPSYTRTGVTDALHEMAGFRTDYEIVRDKAMRGIIRKTRQR